jgi:hypothetical protein
LIQTAPISLLYTQLFFKNPEISNNLLKFKAEGTDRPEGASVFKVSRLWFRVYRPETPGIRSQDMGHRARKTWKVDSPFESALPTKMIL